MSKDKKEERKGSGSDKLPESSLKCCLCDKPIRDLNTAILDKEKKLPSHFECIMDKVCKNETITPMEKIVYIGGGSFGVVNALAYRNGKIHLVRKIQFEMYENRMKSTINNVAIVVQ